MLVPILLSIVAVIQAVALTIYFIDRKNDKKKQFAMRQFLRAEEGRLNRLTDRVNKEIGVAQETPLCARLAALPSAQEFNRVRSLAEGASMICEGIMPDSGIKAQSFDGAVVVTGMPSKG